MLPQGLFGLKPFLLLLPFALVAANVVVLGRARREEFPLGRLVALQLGAGVFALAGAKGFSLAETGWTPSQPLPDLAAGGWRYPGGLAGLVVGLLLLRPWLAPGLSLARYADWNALALPLGHLILRASCFLAGCCVGEICDSAFCLRYPPQSQVWFHQLAAHQLSNPDAGSEPVFPLHFAFAAVALAVFVFLRWFDPKRRFDGQTFLLFLVLHDGAKLALEFLRSPSEPQLATAAALSAGFGLVALLVLWARYASRRVAPAS
jgi:phosphatidylglycerol---prolipoprotein diacylglyceryl transferase